MSQWSTLPSGPLAKPVSVRKRLKGTHPDKNPFTEKFVKSCTSNRCNFTNFAHLDNFKLLNDKETEDFTAQALPKINPLKIKEEMEKLVAVANEIPDLPDYYQEKWENQ